MGDCHLQKGINGRAPEYQITSLESLRFEHITIPQERNTILLTQS